MHIFREPTTTRRPEPRTRIVELTEQLERDGVLPNVIVSALIDRAQRLRLQLSDDRPSRRGRPL
jgi:hypothetical protein